ncbi:MAG: hypothetical protein COV43_06530 [Deltaproteobacteria bacterium CG11_big_fil_rev_8_21_14_0_20_42_23]|nr:MAG: hypothetical protein COV43_06530 [Deltaproteobacteria bacterium CG11_big_fil_rev_8_21_14_0_20_42_23]PJC64844.1 MAG: hypothetical protein CO021_02170 [Deltaproteobacteria bacterium CG_4_9_14_0_2_um_filter_42_21]
MMFSSKKAVMFDFDGTLVDSMGTFATIAAKVMHKYYELPLELGVEKYMQTSGIPFHYQLEVLFPGNTLNKQAAREFEETKKEDYFDKIIFPGVPETLLALKKKNIKTIVSSNNFQELIDTFVEKRHLVFDFVLGFEDGFEKGPHHFEATMKKFSLNPSDILFVGDSLHDGERALEANIDFVGKEGTFSTAEFHARFPHSPVVANIDQLLNLLD